MDFESLLAERTEKMEANAFREVLNPHPIFFHTCTLKRV